MIRAADGAGAGPVPASPDFSIESSEVVARPGSEWALSTDADGHLVVVDERELLAATFGVRFEFPGKDVRSLTAGPDGRLYFFCGEGGASIPRKEGGTLQLPDEGAILRSEPDGSHLEIFCRGLRDPHGLGFDNAGNLFTSDAASGRGDEDRWLCLVEHGDYGWRVGWPHSALESARVPWMAGKLWAPRFDGQAAWILPAVGNIPAGAGSLAHYPGTGFTPHYDDHFFVGNATRHALFSWVAKPNGGTLLFVDPQEIASNVDGRAVAFGPDGKLYFAGQSDAGGTEKSGRLFGFSAVSRVPDPQVEEVRRLLADGLKQKISIELRSLLKHPDQRIRLAAEWGLAASPGGEFLLLEAARSPNGGPEPPIARLHGIWGLGMVARHAEEKTPGAGARILAPLAPLLEDDDLEVRAQAACVLGEQRVGAAFDGLIKVLRNPDEKVSRFAAEALAKLGRAEMLPQLLLMIREAGDHDPYLRHAYVDALLGLDDFEAIEKAAQHDSAAVRMVALLAMRQLRRPEIARFLQDEEPSLVREAAAAINDESIAEAWPPLAALIEKPAADDAVMCRVLNANFHAGQPANATALAAVAGREEASAFLRVEALQLLGSWASPPPYDYVSGAAQSTAEREAAPARDALQAVWPRLLAAKTPEIVAAATTAQEALRKGSR